MFLISGITHDSAPRPASLDLAWHVTARVQINTTVSIYWEDSDIRLCFFKFSLPLNYSLFHVNLRGALVAIEWLCIGILKTFFADLFITPIPFSKLFLKVRDGKIRKLPYTLHYKIRQISSVIWPYFQ